MPVSFKASSIWRPRRVRGWVMVMTKAALGIPLAILWRAWTAATMSEAAHTSSGLGLGRYQHHVGHPDSVCCGFCDARRAVDDDPVVVGCHRQGQPMQVAVSGFFDDQGFGHSAFAGDPVSGRWLGGQHPGEGRRPFRLGPMRGWWPGSFCPCRPSGLTIATTGMFPLPGARSYGHLCKGPLV